MAKIKIVGTNKIFEHLLDKEFCNIEVIKTQTYVVLKNNEIEIFVNENYKSDLSEKGILIEGYCLIGNQLGNLGILISIL
jgi:hypothetical protein